MMALIEKGEPYEAHPAYWAPFVVVGEGGASQLGAASSTLPGGSGQSSVAVPAAVETGSVSAVKAEPGQSKQQRKISRRRRPAGEWGWLGEFWGQ